MIHFFYPIAALLLPPQNSLAAGPNMMERRIWVEQAGNEIENDQCGEKQKQWRCVFPDKNECIKAMREAGKFCRGHVLPELPEYVDGEEGLAQASKVLVECLSLEFSKKHLVGMAKDKLEAYNECTGVTPRSKPLSVGLQKAMEFSKTQTNFTCAGDGYIRKCFGYSEEDCKALLAKSQLGCTMKMEAEGKKVKDEEPAIQEGGKKITECALADARDAAGKARKKTSNKDCQ